MARISLGGKVVGKAGASPVTVRQVTTANGQMAIATCSVMDTDYVYYKDRDDNPGQFYNCEFRGRDAEAAEKLLQLGTNLVVYGKPVWRKYKDNRYLDVKDASFSLIGDRNTEPSENSDPF